MCVPCLREHLCSSSLHISFLFSSNLMENFCVSFLKEFNYSLCVINIWETLDNKFTIFPLICNTTSNFHIRVSLFINFFLCSVYLSIPQTGPYYLNYYSIIIKPLSPLRYYYSFLFISPKLYYLLLTHFYFSCIISSSNSMKKLGFKWNCNESMD